MDVCSSFIYIYSYAIHMSVVCNRMSSVCHPYVLVYHPYTTRMYLYVIRMSLVWTRMLSVCTRMSSICHLYVLVCYPYVTRMGFYYEPLWIANSVNSDDKILLFNNNGSPESNWMLFRKNTHKKNISDKEKDLNNIK